MMRDFLTEFVPMLVVSITIVIGLIVGGAAFVDNRMCDAAGHEMQITTSWTMFGGCMVTLKGQKLPISQVVPVERNGAIVFEPRPRVRIDGETR